MTELEYTLVKKEILALTGVNLDHYKSVQMQRRLDAYLLRTGQRTWSAYFRAIRNDEQAIRHLKEYLTINVSSFLRDVEKWTMVQKILAERLERRPHVRVWSAGCSRGHEPYSVALLLAELLGEEARGQAILATDIDPGALEHARTGGPYLADEVRNVPKQLLSKYFTFDGKNYFILQQLKHSIRFQLHNLLSDAFPGGFDLILCRNVVIYFTNQVKEDLYARFTQSLLPGGYLFVGGTEIVPRAQNLGLTLCGTSFYRKQEFPRQIGGGFAP